MLDFSQIQKGGLTYAELAAGMSREDLAHLTDEMVDAILDRIAGCEDADVQFVPEDPEAYDPSAARAEELEMPWTLGHVIVHTTASAEEAAALAAELARGVLFHGRSRYEVPWKTLTSLDQCRQRLEESRRMRLSSLGMWPDRYHRDNRHQPWTGAESVGAVGRFLMGLKHESDHLEQIDDIVRQAKAARA